ncbi:T9SS type A sorting domain-containing protein [Mariniflexile sp.]|uniref:T9SS type A sorting domain-containing protein n=1 Tax=Mariniflexile sp. TaxID=1979402 RepID=UPI004047583E
MKQLLHFLVFAVCVLMTYSGYSQPIYRVDEQRTFLWDKLSLNWLQNETVEFTFDNGGNKETNSILFEMPGSENKIKSILTYNSNNDVTLKVNQSWNVGSMAWENISKSDYVYDGLNNLISETMQIADLVTMVYINTNRILYAYSGADLVSETNQNWNSVTSTWINNSRDLYEYSGSYVIKNTTQQWAAVSGIWVNKEQSDITYVSVGKPSMVVYKKWNPTNSTWDVGERDTATYTAGVISKILTEKFDGSTWNKFTQVLFTYTNGLETESLNQKWNVSTWLNDNREINTYDANGNNIVNISENWNDFIMEWIPHTKVEKDVSLASPFTLSMASFKVGNFKIYPNPASGVINISSQTTIEKVEMFDVLGKKVLSSSEEKQINIENLKSGVYMLKAFSNNQSAITRVVIK